MPSRSTSSTAKRGRSTPRRKIALACERCREKKVRCDGQKPICGPCERRGYTIEGCIYKADNARSASNDEYLQALLHRIKVLEEACSKAGVAVPIPSSAGDSSRVDSQGVKPAPVQLRNGNDLTPASFDPVQSNVTAMGAILSPEDGVRTTSTTEEFYGSSSTASFMRLARQFMASQPHTEAFKQPEVVEGGRHSEQTPCSNANPSKLHAFWKVSPRFAYEDYSLPPRPLADHLLECYWERVYCLYPFFHRSSFQAAYENLWKSNADRKNPLPDLNIGLGSACDSAPGSIVFYCALNTFFALGCHFSDIPPNEREAVAHSFFLRAKTFVGLDMLDIGNIAVVQVLLNLALFLQSTPYPARCWNSIGVACRVAQGLGLHESKMPDSVKPLEREIRRRTWHGCVIMDLIVSMTYGRPSMTSHLSQPPLPLAVNDSDLERLGDKEKPTVPSISHMGFYVATIELYTILENILSDIYNAWRSRSNNDGSGPYWDVKQGGLDVIIDIDNKLSCFESNLDPVLNWTHPPFLEHTDGIDPLILMRQRNVLHARFIHLRLLLYRPIFTQLCSESAGKLRSSNGRSSKPGSSSATPSGNILYTSVFTNCAVACVKAAVELISFVYDTYKTPVTDAWWYNGFYVSTAGFVLILSYTSQTLLDEISVGTVNNAWQKCEDVLTHMAAFSLCARNTLQFLQATYCQIVQYASALSHENTAASSNGPRDTHQDASGVVRQCQSGDSQGETREFDPTMQLSNYFSNFDEMGLVPDEVGFLGKFDLPDMSSWFSDIPL
ncbi:hypothetical protein VTO42DRAFT_3597 [Malbranchea cinnamomea]